METWNHLSSTRTTQQCVCCQRNLVQVGWDTNVAVCFGFRKIQMVGRLTSSKSAPTITLRISTWKHWTRTDTCVFYFCLVFVCNGKPVGEMEFSRMEAKDMLKHQVRSVRESMADTAPDMPCAQSNKFAKQFLRVLSIWSVLGIADGSMFSSLRAFEASASKALSWWHGSQSPMVLAILCGFVFTLALVAYMVPTDETEPEPE